MKKYQSIICLVAAVCLLGTAAFSIYHIYDHYEQLDEQTEVFDEIAEVVAQAPDEEPVPDDVPVSEGQDVLSKYKELYLQKEDMVGWISISRARLLTTLLCRRRMNRITISNTTLKSSTVI